MEIDVGFFAYCCYNLSMEYSSLENYNDLRNFFSLSSIKQVILCDSFNKTENNIVYQQICNFFSKEFISCLRILKENFDYDQWEDILKIFYEDLKEIYEPDCQVISAFSIEKSKKEKISTKIAKKVLRKNDAAALNFDYCVDPDIIGGIIFKINHICYDASLRKILKILKKEVENE